MTEKITYLINELKNLNLIEINLLITKIEETFNIDTKLINNNSNFINNTIKEIEEIPNKIEEKSKFSIKLIEFPSDKKMMFIKIIKNITGLGLRESKDFVENIPKIIKENIEKEEIEKIKQEIELAGGKILIE